MSDVTTEPAVPGISGAILALLKVPDLPRESVEFRSACPALAMVMRKAL